MVDGINVNRSIGGGGGGGGGSAGVNFITAASSAWVWPEKYIQGLAGET